MQIFIDILTRPEDRFEEVTRTRFENSNASTRDCYHYDDIWRKCGNVNYCVTFYCSKQLSYSELRFLLENMKYAFTNESAGFTLQSIVDNPLRYIGRSYDKADRCARIKTETVTLFSTVRTNLETREATLENLEDQVVALFQSSNRFLK